MHCELFEAFKRCWRLPAISLAAVTNTRTRCFPLAGFIQHDLFACPQFVLIATWSGQTASTCAMPSRRNRLADHVDHYTDPSQPEQRLKAYRRRHMDKLLDELELLRKVYAPSVHRVRMLVKEPTRAALRYLLN